MSKYTTELRFVCETLVGYEESKGYHDVESIIANARSKIFDFKYPIYDNAYKTVLETKIIKHFYTREIGAETVGLWKLWLNTKMNEIMPFYNKLYETETFKFNPMYDVDYTTTGKRDNNGANKVKNTGVSTDRNITETDSTTNSETDTNGTRYTLYSDTPQGALTGVNNETYLTNATKETDINHSESGDTREVKTDSTSNRNITNNEDRTFNNVEDYTEHVVGKRGSVDYSDMLMKYRNSLLNIDMMIIEELDELFLQLW